ncbi:hypothetical protein BN1221_04425 [Brenneria goodwinii]|uniref:Uncharacterized protein n=1 Tax=Brenneria goodwinii TaxID=1109412 RepID=A0A0G4K1D9_9GAMM|nr:hypothetical protein BN1221_04425 [Brenneria goodwinii]
MLSGHSSSEFSIRKQFDFQFEELFFYALFMLRSAQFLLRSCFLIYRAL